MAKPQALSSTPMSLCTGQPSTGHSTPDVPEQGRAGGRITFLNLLTMLLLTQLSTWKLPRHIADSCSVCRPSGPSLQSCFPAGQAQPVLVHRVVPPQGQDLTFAPAELHRVPFNYFSNLNRMTDLCCKLINCSATQANHVFTLILRKNPNLRRDPEENKKCKQTKKNTSYISHTCPSLHHLEGHSWKKSLCMKRVHPEITQCAWCIKSSAIALRSLMTFSHCH